MIKQIRIKRAITAHVEKNSVFWSDYSNWYVGITADPPKRKTEHGKPNYWKSWLTDHPTHAREIEKHFLDKGFQGGPGGGRWPRYIYIYKRSGPGA